MVNLENGKSFVKTKPELNRRSKCDVVGRITALL